MEAFEDFEAPIDDATQIAVDPSGGYESPPQESYAPPQPYTPQSPPVQPDYNRQGDDGVPAWVDDVLVNPEADLESYTKQLIEEVGNRFAQTLAEERLNSKVELAKAAHSGKDGMPSYSELVDRYAVPLMEQQPGLRELVLRHSNPAEAAYLVGFMAAYPHLAREVVKNRKIDKSIFQSTNFRPSIKGKNNGRNQPTGKVNYSDWNNEDFVAELDRFIREGE